MLVSPLEALYRNKLLYLVILLGNISVGKSNIVRRIFNKSFFNDTLTTIGVEFATLEVETDDRAILHIQVWDTCKIFLIL